MLSKTSWTSSAPCVLSARSSWGTGVEQFGLGGKRRASVNRRVIRVERRSPKRSSTGRPRCAGCAAIGRPQHFGGGRGLRRPRIPAAATVRHQPGKNAPDSALSMVIGPAVVADAREDGWALLGAVGSVVRKLDPRRFRHRQKFRQISPMLVMRGSARTPYPPSPRCCGTWGSATSVSKAEPEHMRKKGGFSPPEPMGFGPTRRGQAKALR